MQKPEMRLRMDERGLSYFREFTKGIFRENPIFVTVLGLCPTLAVTITIDNSLGMGFATAFVLLFSAIFVSAIRKVVPSNVRIPVFIVIIATFVTIASLILKAYAPEMNKSLGLFVFLIVVNCIIFGRAEGFSSRNNIGRSILDALGVSIGFTLALLLIGSIREFLGTGKLMLFGINLIDLTRFYNPMLIFILAPGALLTMGLLLALFNWLGSIDSGKQGCCTVEESQEKQEVSEVKKGVQDG